MSKKLTLEEFLEEYNYSSWDCQELVYWVIASLDPKSSKEAKNLVEKAKAWEKANNEFEVALNKVGYKYG